MAALKQLEPVEKFFVGYKASDAADAYTNSSFPVNNQSSLLANSQPPPVDTAYYPTTVDARFYNQQVDSSSSLYQQRSWPVIADSVVEGAEFNYAGQQYDTYTGVQGASSQQSLYQQDIVNKNAYYRPHYHQDYSSYNDSYSEPAATHPTGYQTTFDNHLHHSMEPHYYSSTCQPLQNQVLNHQPVHQVEPSQTHYSDTSSTNNSFDTSSSVCQLVSRGTFTSTSKTRQLWPSNSDSVTLPTQQPVNSNLALQINQFPDPNKQNTATKKELVNKSCKKTSVTGTCEAQCAPKLANSLASSKNNECYVCHRNYARPSTLKTHLRTHTNERPFKCSVCQKTFSQSANLTAHERVHTGERPFSCPQCGRNFSQSSSVITHLRTHSVPASTDSLQLGQPSGERPYECQECSRTFSDSSTLTKHYRIHSGEKPYQCEFCPLNFSQSGNLSRHLKLHQNGATASSRPPS